MTVSIPTGTIKAVRDHVDQIRNLQGEIRALKELYNKVLVRVELCEAFMEKNRQLYEPPPVVHAEGCQCNKCVPRPEGAPKVGGYKGGRPKKEPHQDYWERPKPTPPVVAPAAPPEGPRA